MTLIPRSLYEEPGSHEEIPTKSRSMHLFPMSYEVRTSFSMATNSENQSGTSIIDECKSIPQQSSLSSSCKIEQLMSTDSDIHRQFNSVCTSMEQQSSLSSSCKIMSTDSEIHKKSSKIH